MALSRRTSRTGRSRFTLVLLVLTSVTVLTLDFRGSGAIDDLRGAASTAFGPLRDAGEWAGRPFSDAWNGVFGYDDVKAENEDLQRRVDELESRDAQNEDLRRENDELHDLLGLSQWTDIPSVAARVSGPSLSNFEHTIEIDKGSDQGIAVDMPVVTEAGLVGRIMQVTPNRSVVRLITDPSWSWGARLSRSGRHGTIHGTGDGQPLVIDEGIDDDVDVNLHEPVMTSGFEDSIFPPGVPVGRIAELDSATDHLEQVLRVEPLADLDGLSYVAVLQWTPSP